MTKPVQNMNPNSINMYCDLAVNGLTTTIMFTWDIYGHAYYGVLKIEYDMSCDPLPDFVQGHLQHLNML